MKRHRLDMGQRALIVLLALLLALVAAPGTAAAATEPNGSASCVGLEQASISPPGSSDELPGGAPQFVGEIKAIAAVIGVPAGAVFALVASLHAGSHAECDEALEA